MGAKVSSEQIKQAKQEKKLAEKHSASPQNQAAAKVPNEQIKKENKLTEKQPTLPQKLEAAKGQIKDTKKENKRQSSGP